MQQQENELLLELDVIFTETVTETERVCGTTRLRLFAISSKSTGQELAIREERYAHNRAHCLCELIEFNSPREICEQRES